MSQKGKPSLEEMWKFMDSVIRPHPLVPDRSVLTEEQVFEIYSKLCDIEDMFVEYEQMHMLKGTRRNKE